MTAVGWPPAIFLDQNPWSHDCHPRGFLDNEVISLMERIAEDQENARQLMQSAMASVPIIKEVFRNFRQIITPIHSAKSAFTLGDIPIEILQESTRIVSERESIHSVEMKFVCNYLVESFLIIAKIFYPHRFTVEESGYLRLLLKTYFIPFVESGMIGKRTVDDHQYSKRFERLQKIATKLSE